MAEKKGTAKKLRILDPIDLVGAVREVAKAIRYQEEARASRMKLKSKVYARRQIAVKLLTWVNLVFVALVVADAFSADFNPSVAYIGAGLFLGVYLFAYGLMRGGES